MTFRRLRRCYLGLLLVVGQGVACVTPVHAQAFPTKPLRIVVPFATGGGVDIVARILADDLSKRSGITAIVENRTGAGGNIGTAAVARADADGHTLLLASNSNAVNNSLYANLPYDASKDLAPIVLIGTVPMVMLVNPNVPAKNLQELIRLAKAKPKSLAFGSGGIGTGEHLVLELFLRRAGVDLVHVPYKGGTAVFTDLIGGQIQGRFSNELAATPFVRSGQLRAIAITGSERSKGLPELPTFDEQGVRGLETFAWWGVMGPSGIPAEASAKLNALFNASLASAEVRQRLVALGATVQGGSSAKFGEFFRAETELWSGIIKEANIRAE